MGVPAVEAQADAMSVASVVNAMRSSHRGMGYSGWCLSNSQTRCRAQRFFSNAEQAPRFG